MLYFIRTCQECFHQQKAQRPSDQAELTTTYKAAKCKKCNAEALDYGSDGWSEVSKGKFERLNDDWY